MTDATRILAAIESGDAGAASQLLPLVYHELRRLASKRLAQERPGQTLQTTALVHEAYIRLVDTERTQHFNSRGHFFAAAAEAMRRILVENARRQRRLKHGGGLVRQANYGEIAAREVPERLLAVHEALDRLAEASSEAAELAKLRYFAGFSNAQAADILGISPRKASQIWAYARAWLSEELAEED